MINTVSGRAGDVGIDPLQEALVGVIAGMFNGMPVSIIMGTLLTVLQDVIKQLPDDLRADVIHDLGTFALLMAEEDRERSEPVPDGATTH